MTNVYQPGPGASGGIGSWVTDPAAGFQPPSSVPAHTHDAADVAQSSVPVGVINAYYGTTAPSGWLICDGGSFSAGTYPALAATLGGTTLPDLRQRFPMGKAAAGTGSTLGGTGGSKDAIAVTHNHTQDVHGHGTIGHSHGGTTDSTGSHDHAEASAGSLPLVVKTASALGLAAPGDGQATYDTGKVGRTSSDGNHQHVISSDADAVVNATATNQAAGSSGTDANLPPWLAISWIIKAA